MIKGPVIYKRDEAGKVRVWQYYVDGAKFGAISGVEGGKQVVSKPKTATAKSQKTNELQALFEAEAMMVKKIRIEYHTDRADIDKPGLKPFLPMLAHPYVTYDRDQVATYTVITFPVYSQPKFDGLRSVMGMKGAFSREGKQQGAHPHIVQELSPFIAGPFFQFDGELYNHALKDDFNKIVSIFRKTKPTDVDLETSRKIGQFHVYDCFVPGLKFKDRLTVLKDIFARGNFRYVKPTDTVLCHNQEELDNEYSRLLEEGYEGQIIRYPDEVYVPNQRQPHLVVKRKQFVTEEFEILEVLEGTGNWEGAAKFVNIRQEDGQECKTGLNGTFLENAERLRNADKYVGGQATVRYLNRTPDNKLRGGVAVDLFMEERED